MDVFLDNQNRKVFSISRWCQKQPRNTVVKEWLVEQNFIEVHQHTPSVKSHDFVPSINPAASPSLSRSRTWLTTCFSTSSTSSTHLLNFFNHQLTATSSSVRLSFQTLLPRSSSALSSHPHPYSPDLHYRVGLGTAVPVTARADHTNTVSWLFCNR